MSISAAFNVSRSGLRATEERATMVAGNIANASTPGYARRDAAQTSGTPAGQGSTVEVRIARQVDDRLAAMTRRAGAEAAGATVTGEVLNGYLGTLGNPGDEISPAARVAEFQTSLDLLVNAPNSAGVQRGVLLNAESLVKSLNTASQSLTTATADAAEEFGRTVGTVNAALSGIAQLNDQLQLEVPGTQGEADLRDRIGRALDDLSRQMQFDTRWESDGTLTLHTTGGAELVRGSEAAAITFDPQTGTLQTGNIDITPGVPGARGFSEGRLAELSTLLSDTLPQMGQQLDELARVLVQSFEAADASIGPGQAGLFTDAGAAFDPAQAVGLAGRISINDAVRPEAGGGLWRLRDGMGAATPGDAGATAQIGAFIDALSAPQGFAPGAGLGTNRTIGDYAATLVGAHQNIRVSAEARAEGGAVKLATFEDSRAGIEGVNIDTELQKLLEIEQAYGANSQVLTSLTSMIDTLLDAV